MLRLGSEKETLSIVDDQFGAPTSARDLVNSIIHIIDTNLDATGIYNYCNSGKTTWLEFAGEIFKMCEIDCHTTGISTASYGAPAPRPLWSVLSTEKIQYLLPEQIPHWKQSLRECLEELGAMT